MAWHTGRIWLWLKPTQIYVRLNVLPFSQQVTYISLGITAHYVSAFTCLYFALPGTRVLNSLEELCIMWVAAINSFTNVLNPLEGSLYMYHPQTDCFVVSQLFSMARLTKHFRLGSKPPQLYFRLSMLPFSHQATYIYIYIYICIYVWFLSLLNSISTFI